MGRRLAPTVSTRNRWQAATRRLDAWLLSRASNGAASAAGLPMKAVPYAAPPPVFGWTGFYIGGHAGAGVLLDQGILSQGSLLNGPEALADWRGIGGLAGGQIGYNGQMGMFVLGIEGEGFGQA